MNPEVLPAGLTHVRTTDMFDERTVPAGLQRAHRVADGVWARLVVHTGTVGFVFEDGPEHELAVAAGDAVVIPPGRLHHVVVRGPATFAVEFHREAAAPVPRAGTESTAFDTS